MCFKCEYFEVCEKIKNDINQKTYYKVFGVCYWKNSTFKVFIESIEDQDVQLLKYNIESKTDYICSHLFRGIYFVLPEIDVIFVKYDIKNLV